MMPRAFITLRCVMLALLLGLPLFARGATTPATGRTNAPAASTNAPVEIPKSTFVLPGEGSAGRDPFYPKSVRINSMIATKKPGDKKAPPAPVAALKLSGISITPGGQALAIINGTTFAAGDELTVPGTTGGRVRVLCVEVRPDDQTAVVEIAGERKELRLATKK